MDTTVMAHFCEIKTSDNIVLRTMVVNDQDVANNGGEYTTESENWVANHFPNAPLILEEYGGNYPDTYWKQTSFNTSGGVYYVSGDFNQEHSDQSKAKRKNYGAPGMIYDSTRDAFYHPQPHNSWVLNETRAMWEAPVAYPTNLQPAGDGQDYIIDWDEDNLRWWSRNNDGNIYYYWNPDNSTWNTYTP